jgi:DNA-3-methyladenine glycosylase
MSTLPRAFFARPALEVAEDLLGCLLVHGEQRARIVETEAYVGPQDLACHAARGRTARTEVLWGEPGLAYVYLIYGMYHCLNAVTDPAGHPAAVLVRAAEPLSPDLASLSGPGRLCRSLGVDRSHNRLDLTDPASPLRLEPALAPVGRITRSPRIGVDYAGAWARKPYRFCVADCAAVSKPWPWAKRRR